MNLQIEILNPDVRSLLEELEKLNLIRVKESNSSRNDFLDLVKRIRGKSDTEMSLEEITKEVEIVRNERCQERFSQNN